MKITIDERHFELMIDYHQIKKRTRLIGIQLNVAYEKQHPVFLGVLNGCFMFMADLMKQIHVACDVSFVKLSSYRGAERQARIRELIGLDMSLTGRDVVIVRSEEHTSELQSRE